MQTSRRRFLTVSLAAPAFIPLLRAASPNGKIRHVSFGGSGQAWSDLQSIAASPHIEVAAVAEVDKRNWEPVQKTYPNAKLYHDWRELIAQEHSRFDSANVSTPDHVHAAIACACIAHGKHVYGEKPLTHNLKECRHLTLLARGKGVVTQMGIQASSELYERLARALLAEQAIGKVKEVHSFSNKEWGDSAPVPQKSDPVPAGFAWDLWLGPAAERPWLEGYYHPNVWRKRRDFGTGTLGDMGCHMFSGWFRGLELTAPLTVKSTGPAPGKDSWAINGRVEYQFPPTSHTTSEGVRVVWYDGGQSRPPKELAAMIGGQRIPAQGSLYIGTEGVLLHPHLGRPHVFMNDKSVRPMPKVELKNHYLEWVDCIREGGRPSANFDVSGPLTEAVLLGCLASQFPHQALDWEEEKLRFKSYPDASAMTGRSYRKGWEIPGLA